MRLQKYLAEAGLGSRRACEALIRAGRVLVNGAPASLGAQVEADDEVLLDGARVGGAQRRIAILFYKPRGVVCTSDDPEGRRTVQDYFHDVPERLYNVGRLDLNSEGLLLMTNDGEFANKVAHPKSNVAKTYRVTVRPQVNEEQLTRMSTGVVIDGRKTAPAKVRVLQQEQGRVVLEIVLYEGRNREIRKMCEALGLEVARLKRVAIGPVRLGMLQQGKHRELTKEEIRGLLAEAGKGKGGEPRDTDPSHGGQRKRAGTAGPGRRGRR